MADPTYPVTPKPMSDGDITPPPANADFTPAAPLKDAGVDFEPVGGGAVASSEGRLAGARQQLADGAAKAKSQATDKARVYAEDGKARATGALGELAKMLGDAAGQVDNKLGAQYGQYARGAADQVQGFASTLDSKSVDELFDDARELVRKSPAVAIGVAAAAGFALARLLSAGLDQRDADKG